MELLFDNQRTLDIDVPVNDNNDQLTVREIISWMRENILTERPEMFMKGDTVYVDCARL